MNERPRFYFFELPGRLYCDQNIDGIATGIQKIRKGTVIYLIGEKLRKPMAEKIAAMLGGTLEVE